MNGIKQRQAAKGRTVDHIDRALTSSKFSNHDEYAKFNAAAEGPCVHHAGKI